MPAGQPTWTAGKAQAERVSEAVANAESCFVLIGRRKEPVWPLRPDMPHRRRPERDLPQDTQRR